MSGYHLIKALRISLICGLAVIMLGGVLPDTAKASHFRGGDMWASVDANGLVTITAKSRWRKGASTFPFAGVSNVRVLDCNTRAQLAFQSVNILGTTSSTDVTDPAFNERIQTWTYDLSAQGFGTYIFYHSSCCRVAGINNAPESTFSLEFKIIYDGTPRTTPRILSQVVTVVARGQNYSNNLNAAGTAPLTYNFIVGATSPRFGPSSQIPGIMVDGTGQVDISSANTNLLVDNVINLGADYVFKVQVTDPSGMYTEQDVMLDCVDSQNTICTIAVDDPNPMTFPDQPVVITVTASDPDSTDNLTISAFPNLPGATLVQVGSNPAVATYTFTPTCSLENTTLGVNFSATDDGIPPLTCVVNAQIDVGPCLVEGDIDIKPTSCPNPLGVVHRTTGNEHAKKGGVIPVAVLGSDDLDVSQLDPASMQLEGVDPLRSKIEDVAGPVVDRQDECECTTAGPDGHADLTLKYRKGDIISALGGAASLNDGDVLVLTMSGNFLDGRRFEGKDCMVVRLNGGANRPDDSRGGPNLAAPVPNPFNPVTSLKYEIDTERFVRLAIYDVTGKLITELVNKTQKAGSYTVVWDADNAPSGVYFARFEAGGVVQTRKMTLLK